LPIRRSISGIGADGRTVRQSRDAFRRDPVERGKFGESLDDRAVGLGRVEGTLCRISRFSSGM